MSVSVDILRALPGANVTEDIVRAAQERAQTTLRAMRTVGDALNTMKAIEETLVEVHGLLQTQVAQGIATREHIRVYDMMRVALYQEQLRLWGFLQTKLVMARTGVQLPMPQMFPAVSAPRVAALGAAPAVAAAPAIGLTIQFWAVAVIAALVAVVVIALLLYSFADEITDLAVKLSSNHGTVAMYRDMLAARGAIYAQCIASGGTPADCAAASVIVAPRGPQLAEADKDSIVLWIVFGSVGTIVTGFFLWRWLRKSGSMPAMAPTSGTVPRRLAGHTARRLGPGRETEDEERRERAAPQQWRRLRHDQRLQRERERPRDREQHDRRVADGLKVR
jgi:hypothetical protein